MLISLIKYILVIRSSNAIIQSSERVTQDHKHKSYYNIHLHCHIISHTCMMYKISNVNSIYKKSSLKSNKYIKSDAVNVTRQNARWKCIYRKRKLILYIL